MTGKNFQMDIIIDHIFYTLMHIETKAVLGNEHTHTHWHRAVIVVRSLLNTLMTV